MTAQTSKDYTSKALKEASERKAKKIHFYQNGRPYDAKLTISLLTGKDFSTFEQLCQFLTTKSQLLNGVQYIFTTNGKRVTTLNELEHGQSYVISGSKNFFPYPYGIIKPAVPKISRVSNRYKFIREDDLRLLRPLSSKYNNVYSNQTNNCLMNNSNNRDNRIVTVVNNKNHTIFSKVILNLKSPKSFEILLQDLGQTVKMKFPKRMFTLAGQEVKSVSHLKHELSNIDLFYVDDENATDFLSYRRKSHSLESIDDIYEFNSRSLFRPTYSYSSNLDLRPNQIISNSSLSSSIEIDKRWQDSNVVIRSSTVMPRLQPEPTDSCGNQNKQKLQSTSPNVNKSKTKVLPVKVASKTKNSSISSASNSPSNETINKENIFSIDHISPEKNEQIQKYVEKLLQDTSIQIQNEGLILKSTEQRTNDTMPTLTNDKHEESVAKTNLPINSINSSSSSARVSPNTSTPAEKHTNKAKIQDKPIIESKLISKKVPKLDQSNKQSNNLAKSTKSNESKIEEPKKQKTNNLQTNQIITKTSVRKLNSSDIKQSHLPSKKPYKLKEKLPSDNQNCKTSPINANHNLVPNKPTKKQQKTNPSKPQTENDPSKFLYKGVNIPNSYLELNRVMGYNGTKCKNLFLLTTGELAFHSGVFAVLWNPESGVQRFYTEHDNDICCMRTDSKNEIIATSQVQNSLTAASIIKIWSVDTLQTIATLTDKIFNLKFTDMEFTLNKSLFVVNSDSQLNISLWNWSDNRSVSSTSKTLEEEEEVFGGTVHPVENDIMVTYGKMHLMVWHLNKDNTIDCRTALQTHSKLDKTVFCADFLKDNSLLTGDSIGNLTIWAPFEVNRVLEFAIKEVKAHESKITCFKLTSDNILISGDQNGTIKTWDVSEGEFRLLNAVKLPAISGSVCSITLPNTMNENFDIFVGTSQSLILKGSALDTSNYEIIFEGHLMAIRSVSFDPHEDAFYTASLDEKVCKWSNCSLIWKSNANGVSSSVHPSGEVLAVGSVNGIISIISTADGQVMQHLQLASACIGCMSYSPDGNFLVAGCQNGNLHVLPVTDNGHSYSKMSILKGPLPILTLQWSTDTQFILTSVDDNNYQELILWDLPNTRYIRNVTNFSDNLQWYNPTCSGLDDARGTWDNEQLKNVINICTNYSPSLDYIVTGDEKGFIRLFSYPCSTNKVAFFQYKQGGGSVTDVKISPSQSFVVTCSFEGMILLWNRKNFSKIIKN